MIDFSKVNVKIDEEWLLSRLNPSTIFRLYHGDFTLGKVYPSVFRKDKDPSCGFFIHKGTGALLYNDIAQGEKLNCIQFVMKLHDLKYYAAINKIAADFGLIEGKKIVSDEWLRESDDFEEEIKREEVLIQFIHRSFTKEDLEYWAQYEITKEELEKENIFSVESLFLNKREIKNFKNEVRFAYPIHQNGETKVKIYTPYSKTIKWLSSIPNDWCFGLNGLKFESDTVFITKSRKDELVLKKIFTDVISVQNESEQSLSLHDIFWLEIKYKNIIIAWDSDPPGLVASKKMLNKGFKTFNIPENYYLDYGITDFSDFVKTFNVKELKNLFYKEGYLTK